MPSVAPAGGGAGVCRILVVEDDLLVADLVTEMLLELGYEPIGPVPSLERGFEMLERTAPNGAILDLNLNGVPAYPLAEQCMRQGIPVVLATGYADKSMMPEDYRNLPSLEKPFHFDALKAVLQSALMPASKEPGESRVPG